MDEKAEHVEHEEKVQDKRIADLEKALGKRTHIVSALVQIITLMIALIALVQSSTNNATSVEANRIAEEALRTSTNQFFQINRPYLTVTLTKNREGTYVKQTRIGRLLYYTFEYEIKNVGNISAKEVVFPNQLKPVGDLKLPTNAPVRLSTPNAIGILPGETKPFKFVAELECSSDHVADREVEHWQQGLSKGVAVGFQITYTHSLDSQKKYETRIKEVVKPDHSVIVDSGFVDIDPK